MKSGSLHILGHKSRKTWILLGLASIVLVSLLGVEWVRAIPRAVGAVALTFLSQAT